MSESVFPVSEFVVYLHARGVRPVDVDRLVCHVVRVKSRDASAPKLDRGLIAHANAFIRKENGARERLREQRRRIHELARTADSAANRARLEAVLLAVQALGMLSESTR